MNFETAFDLLTHEYRRAIVAVLTETSPISRRRLTDRVAERVVESGDERPDRTTRYRIRIALHHNHLPRLADAGAIEYDDETVRATPELTVLVDCLEPVERNVRVASTDLGNRLAEFYA